MPTILVVDDELSMREFLKILLEKEGYEVTTASEASSAIDLIQEKEFDLVLSDIKMPGMDGIEFVKTLDGKFEVIIMTGHGSDKDEEEARRLGAFEYLRKPVDIEQLMDASTYESEIEDE